jgi:hypothetical protein
MGKTDAFNFMGTSAVTIITNMERVYDYVGH